MLRQRRDHLRRVIDEMVTTDGYASAAMDNVFGGQGRFSAAPSARAPGQAEQDTRPVLDAMEGDLKNNLLSTAAFMEREAPLPQFAAGRSLILW